MLLLRAGEKDGHFGEYGKGTVSHTQEPLTISELPSAAQLAAFVVMVANTETIFLSYSHIANNKFKTEISHA